MSGPFEMVEGEDSLLCEDGICLVPEPVDALAEAPGPEVPDPEPAEPA